MRIWVCARKFSQFAPGESLTFANNLLHIVHDHDFHPLLALLEQLIERLKSSASDPKSNKIMDGGKLASASDFISGVRGQKLCYSS